MDFDFFDSVTEHGNNFHTEPNIFGGDNIYDHTNHEIGHTESNIFGGHNIYSDAGSFIGQTTPNIFGGIEIDLLKNFNPIDDIPDFDLGSFD